jgi:hypothetical protein
VLSRQGMNVERTATRGGDSLMVLMTAMNAVGASPGKQAKAPSKLARAAVTVASNVLRPYYWVGDDELVVVARA